VKLANIVKRLGSKSEEDLEREIAELAAEKRGYGKSLGFLAEDAHARVDRLVARARDLFAAQVASPGKIPDEPDNQLVGRFVAAYILASDDFAKAAHRAVDAATKAGNYDVTPRADVDAKLAGYDEQTHDRELELQRRLIAARKEAADAELAEFEAGVA